MVTIKFYYCECVCVCACKNDCASFPIKLLFCQIMHWK